MTLAPDGLRICRAVVCQKGQLGESHVALSGNFVFLIEVVEAEDELPNILWNSSLQSAWLPAGVAGVP